MTESTQTTRVAPLPCDALAAERTLVMGILNVTPDSFSDGGQHYAATDAIAHAARGVWAVRVHDVPASVDAVTIASALRAVM